MPPRSKRKYGLFARIDGKWQRMTPLDLYLHQARTTFQTALLAITCKGFEVKLRPVTGWGDESEDVYSARWAVVKEGRKFVNQDS